MPNSKKTKSNQQSEADKLERKRKREEARIKFAEKKKIWSGRKVVSGTDIVIDENRPLKPGEVAEIIIPTCLHSRHPVKVVSGTNIVIDEDRPLKTGEVAEIITCATRRARKPVKVVSGKNIVIDKDRPLKTGEVAEIITQGLLAGRKPVKVVEGTAILIDQNRSLQPDEVDETVYVSTYRARKTYGATNKHRIKNQLTLFGSSANSQEEPVPMTPNTEAAVSTLMSLNHGKNSRSTPG